MGLFQEGKKKEKKKKKSGDRGMNSRMKEEMRMRKICILGENRVKWYKEEAQKR